MSEGGRRRPTRREEGARGLWAGTVPALFLWVPYTAVQFAALGEFRRRVAALDLDATKPPLAFVGGAVAGATATVCTYPFDVMRTVLAAQGSPRVYESLAGAARGIVRDRGARGLYAGVGVTLAEIIPASAIQFGTYALFAPFCAASATASRTIPRAAAHRDPTRSASFAARARPLSVAPACDASASSGLARAIAESARKRPSRDAPIPRFAIADQTTFGERRATSVVQDFCARTPRGEEATSFGAAANEAERATTRVPRRRSRLPVRVSVDS